MNQNLRAPGFLILGLFFWGRCTMNPNFASIKKVKDKI